MEEWKGKGMKIAKMAKLTVLIKIKRIYLVLFILGNCYWILCLKQKKSEILILGFVD